MKKINVLATIAVSLFNFAAVAHTDLGVPNGPVPALVDTRWLNELKIPAIYTHEKSGVALAMLTGPERMKLSTLAHKNRSCGGYHVVEDKVFEQKGALRVYSQKAIDRIFAHLNEAAEKEAAYKKKKATHALSLNKLDYDPNIAAALSQVSESELGSWVTWLESFGGRFHASADPNRHTQALADRLRVITQGLPYASVNLISHNRSAQKSVSLRLQGSEKPNEIVVLGGHLDSINHEFFGNKNNAPGADDNASGSAAILESLRVFLAQGQPKRTVEYFWYAAEEVGLYGSDEIAATYRSQNKDVVAVLQLDMTMYPGLGVGTIGNVSDFTSGWLRDLLVDMNSHYIKARLVDDKCGYACSDHASWYQKGYSTLMPFEANTEQMNSRIHTPNDKFTSALSLPHAAMFSKIALAYSMILANSNMRGDR